MDADMLAISGSEFVGDVDTTRPSSSDIGTTTLPTPCRDHVTALYYVEWTRCPFSLPYNNSYLHLIVNTRTLLTDKLPRDMTRFLQTQSNHFNPPLP